MRNLISFLAGKQFREVVLRDSDERYKMITYLLVIGTASFSIGWFLASFYDSGIREGASGIEKLPLFVSLFLAVNFLLLDFYPVYKINPFLFPSYYPIGKFEKAIIVFVIYSINYYSLFVLLTYLVFVVFSEYFGFVELFFSLLLVYSAYLINRTVKNITEYSVPGGKLIFLIAAGATIGYLVYLYYFPLERVMRYRLMVILAGVLFLCFAFSEADKKERIRKSSRWSFWKKNVYTSIFLNKNLFTTISYGFFFKGMWLLVAILGMTEASGSNGVSRVTWQFASPLILFLYTGINFFGYSKNLFFTSAIRETNFRNLASLFFATIGIIMIVDSMLFWGFIWAADQIQWVHILFYYTSVVVLAVISFWVAIYNPIFTDNFLFFDFGIIKNRGKDFNFWGVGLLVLVSFILDEIRYTDYQLIISIAGVFAALMSLYYLKEVDYFKIARSAFSRMHNL